MVVLVAAGAMGLHWVLLIAALVAAEKLAPGGAVIARTAGIALVVLGVLVAVNPGTVPVAPRRDDVDDPAETGRVLT